MSDTTKTEHTRGPLRCVNENANGGIDLRILGGDELVTRIIGGTLDRKLANARRLVALWNACEGLSTEVLERIALQSPVDRLGWLAEVAQREHLRLRLATDGMEDSES